MSNQLEIVLFPCLNDNYGFLIHDNDTGETVSIDTPEVDKIVATILSTSGVSMETVSPVSLS